MKIVINGETIEIPSGVGVPKGTIVIWSGTESDIPDGWALCDGQDGRPDLRGKFVLGAGSSHAAGTSGGAETVTLTVDQIPSHNHKVSTPGATHNNTLQTIIPVSGILDSSTEFYQANATVPTGGSQPHNNMPPYYTLCYIIKLPEIPASTYNVFGVCWDYSSPSTVLARLTPETDPNGLVTTSVDTEPVPAVGNGAGSSPFDAFYPWNKMDEWNVVNGNITVKRGQSGFSRTANDVVVFIPEFYFKVVNDTANNKRYYYISQKAATGFTKHPGSGRCVGKYNTGAGYVSKSGLAPLVNITRAAARTGHKGRGAKFNNYDFASWCAVQLLYLVEFANWDSQSKVGRGYVDDNSAAINSGACDSMTYHTGRPAGTDGRTAVMYRWIENPWGNVFDWVDGANFSDLKCYICTNPDNFADDTTANYTDSGVTLPSSGWISDYGFSSNFPWALIPITASSSETTFTCDYIYSNSGWRVLAAGGVWTNSGSAGLFCFHMNFTSSNVGVNYGARQLYVPTAAEISQMAA